MSSSDSEDAFDALPPFASESNKALDREVRALEKEVADLEVKGADADDRLKVMKQHLGNVRQELVNTQQLVDAKAREIESEDHLKQLAERERARVVRELKGYNSEIAGLQEKLNATQNEVYRNQEVVEQIKQQMDWNNEELEQWAQAAQQKEEDNLALERYRRQDEAKIRDLDLQIQRLTKSIAEKKKLLADEVTETQACQIELDKTAEDFRKLHRERQELISQFQGALEAMRRRDQAIRDAAEAFAAGKGEVARRQEDLQERNKFVDAELARNKEVEAEIAAAERYVARTHTERLGQEQELTVLRDEVEVMRNAMQGSAQGLQKARSELQGMRVGIEDNKKEIAALEHEFEVTKHRLESEFQHTDDLEVQSRQLEDLRVLHEEKRAQREKEIRALRDQQFKLSQQLFKLRQKESTLVAEMSGSQSALKNINTTIAKLDAESQKQQELVYAAEFQIQQMERKVSRAQGERTEDEKKELMARIEHLQGSLAEHNATHKMLSQQRKRVADDLREKRRQVDRVASRREKLEEVIAGLNLACDTTQLALVQLQKKHEGMMVQHDLLQLDITKLRDALNERADEVFGLENRKAQLKLSMEEREHEIAVHREVLQSSFKIVDEERHKAHLQLADRRMKLDKVKKKYELIMARFAPSNDPDAPEGQSEAYYLIKAAQEKQVLEREGDELDAQIRKAEKEVRALENTLGMLNTRNSRYRQSFHKVDGQDPDLKNREQMRDQLRALNDRVKFKKSEIRELQSEIANMRRSTTVLKEDRLSLSRRLQDLEMQRAQVEKEAGEYAQKVREAHDEMERLARKHRLDAGVGAETDTVEERDFRLQELRGQNDELLAALAQISRHPRNTAVAVHVEQLLDEIGLELPEVREDDRDPHGGGGPPPGSGRASSRFAGRAGGGRRSITPAGAGY